MLSSRTFAHAERLRAFLRFVVEESLDGRGGSLKEWVDANRLRARLAAYYDSEGQNEPLRIQLPKGAYVPTFVVHSAIPSDCSLVVLPFVSLSSRDPDSHFADGLTEELIHSLARLLIAAHTNRHIEQMIAALGQEPSGPLQGGSAEPAAARD